MALKVVIPENERAVTVGGLYQWDYGQALEIECAELGSEIVEVHFACIRMAEAIVRPCTFANGVGTVIIPDQCLEQTSAITAWIYRVDSTQGHTVKTITLPVTARTRPSKTRDVPPEYVDKYAEAIEEINEAVNALEKGNVTVAKAQSAETAGSATSAESAKNATYASSAGSASKAEQANRAQKLLVSTDYPYCSITITDGVGTTVKNFEEGLYLVTYTDSDGKTVLSGIGFIGANEGSLNTYFISVGAKVVYYEEYGSDSTSSGAGAAVSVLNTSGDPLPISGNGTLAFIKIGIISHG